MWGGEGITIVSGPGGGGVVRMPFDQIAGVRKMLLKFQKFGSVAVAVGGMPSDPPGAHTVTGCDERSAS